MSDRLTLLDRLSVRPFVEMSVMDYESIITIEPGKRGGKPCIRGLRIAVHDILDCLASGMSEAQILAAFAELQSNDIHTCLAFAADRERRLVGQVTG